VKAIDVVPVCHGGDVQLLASASSDGEVKALVISSDGEMSESGAYDTGNRLMCLVVHDVGIEQLDMPSFQSKEPVSDLSSSDEEDLEDEEDDDEDDEEWHGIEDA
jgi:hypothetical protein